MVIPILHNILKDASIENPTGQSIAIVGSSGEVVYLNGETIRNNVVFLEEGEGETERIISCLEKAQIWEDVRALPDGIDTLIGENGTALSDGQRQRIALAKALYKEFKLLIMDEATAALDVETEKAVMDAIYHMGGKNAVDCYSSFSPGRRLRKNIQI